MLCPRPLRISEPCAPERRASDSRARHSTELFLTLCARAAISQITTALEESPSMEPSSLMRTSSLSIPDLESWAWQTLDQTQTVLSSSFALPRPHGWMENTLSSDKLSREWILSKRLSHMGPSRARPQPKSLLLTAVNFKTTTTTAKRFKTYFISNIFLWKHCYSVDFQSCFPSPPTLFNKLLFYFKQ